MTAHSHPVVVRPVLSQRDLMAFIKFPFRLYKDDPYWVPPLIAERKLFFNPRRNPFYDHAEVQLFLAERAGQVVGTISAHINHTHNEFHDEKVGFFGFFEVMDDPGAAQALLHTACVWVHERGMAAIRGPMNFSTNEESGLLVDGFDCPPVVFMTYNPRYYQGFIEAFGMHKAMDLWAYKLDIAAVGQDMAGFPPKLKRVVDLAMKRQRFTVRKVNMKDFENELGRAKVIYNSAWQRNWGFVPMSDEEIDHLARGVKGWVDPNLIFIAEIDGRPVGVSISLPDMNQPLLHMGGRLLPFGWLKYLWHRRRISICRVFAMGVLEEYRAIGIDAVFYYLTAKNGLPKGYAMAEMSWILENNTMMNRAIQMLGGTVYKTYRVYEYPLQPTGAAEEAAR
ncbi:MAG: N-acetyltransferase [Chloroflexi bacterium]|nr:N-acetyltransferase [Chloroflexota bacterium]